MLIRSAVNSTTIRSVGYDFDTRELELIFTTGKVYAYAEVPPMAVHELIVAESIGEYFNHHIRDHFAYQEKTTAPERHH